MKAKALDWSREPASEQERMVRETFLARESSDGLDGLIAVILLARRQRVDGDGLAIDLEAAEAYAVATLTDAVGYREAAGVRWATQYVGEHGAPFIAGPSPVPSPDEAAFAAVHHRRRNVSKIERFLQTG